MADAAPIVDLGDNMVKLEVNYSLVILIFYAGSRAIVEKVDVNGACG